MPAIKGAKAYVLHSFPYRETSLIVEVFAENYGRIPLIARGARRPLSALRGILMAYQPISLDWSGKGELLTLIRAEWLGGIEPLSGRALLCAYYANELLLELLAREDSHPKLFQAYEDLIKNLVKYQVTKDKENQTLQEISLRIFEKQLLEETGFGLSLIKDHHGNHIEKNQIYTYHFENGATPVNLTNNYFNQNSIKITGKTLLDLAKDDLSCDISQGEAKILMRNLLNHYRQGKPLKTRGIFRELCEL